MRIDGTFLRSKVARRIVLLFVLSALVPIALSAALSFRQVRDLLVDQGHARLAQTSEGYAASLYDRLLAVEQRMNDIAERIHLGSAAPAGDQPARLQRQFKSICIVDAAGRGVPLLGEMSAVPPMEPEQRRRLKAGEFALAGTPASGGESKVFLARALDPADPTAGSLVAEIDSTYLWGDITSLPAMTGLCVVDEQGQMLFCSHESGAAAVLASQRKHGCFVIGTSVVRIRRRAVPCRLSRIIPPAAVRRRGWTIVAAKLETDVLRADCGVQGNIRSGGRTVALLIAALLSVTQVRRTLGPLEKLIEGTRARGGPDFRPGSPYRPTMNSASSRRRSTRWPPRLGSQFKALLTLADIDHAILSRLDLDRVIETVVMRMGDIVPADYVGIAVVDRNAPAMVRI